MFWNVRTVCLIKGMYYELEIIGIYKCDLV